MYNRKLHCLEKNDINVLSTFKTEKKNILSNCDKISNYINDKVVKCYQSASALTMSQYHQKDNKCNVVKINKHVRA